MFDGVVGIGISDTGMTPTRQMVTHSARAMHFLNREYFPSSVMCFDVTGRCAPEKRTLPCKWEGSLAPGEVTIIVGSIMEDKNDGQQH
jgi:hypothetical protein